MKVGADTSIVSNRFQWLKNAVPEDVRQINSDAGDEQVTEQVRLCPVSEEEHTHLYETIHKEEDGDVVKVVEGGPDHDYWPNVEHGTDRMAAKAHIRPAHAKAKEYRDKRLAELPSKYK